MSVALFLLGILAAVLMIAVSIGLHEVGHLVPAKRFGLKVPQYMIGFGPTLWSKQVGETEYGVKAIPLGGYIRMIGMYPPPSGNLPAGKSGRLAELSEQAKVDAWREVGPGEENRVFYRLPVPRRVVVMLGGPLMNLFLATVLFAVLLVGIGFPQPVPTVASVSECVPAVMASERAAQAFIADPASATGECVASDPESPASASGLQPGETITAIDGIAVSTWTELTDYTRARPGEQVKLTITGPAGERTAPVTLATAYRPVLDDAGEPTGEIARTGYLGITPAAQYIGRPWSSVPSTMWEVTKLSVGALVSLPVKVFDLAGSLATNEPRDPNSPVSVVGVGRLSGEVTAMDEPIKTKVATLVSLAASLNLFLFLFNLVPVLPLDGGHIAGALWEGLRRRVATLRGRADPGPVDTSRMLPVAYAMVVLLLALSSVVILADLIKPISLNG
ncbi:MAG: M50 family metallopeptidase [Candidatus Nanopelagicales bacterium]